MAHRGKSLPQKVAACGNSFLSPQIVQMPANSRALVDGPSLVGQMGTSKAKKMLRARGPARHKSGGIEEESGPRTATKDGDGSRALQAGSFKRIRLQFRLLMEEFR
jgi:hypothetical protein